MTRHTGKTAAAALLMLLAAACGSGGGAQAGATAPSSSAPAPSSSPSAGILCQDLARLRDSLGNLSPKQIKASPGTVPASLAEAQAALTALVNDAQGQWHAQAGALRAALTHLQATLKDLAASPSTQQAVAVQAAATGVVAAAQQLLSTLGTRCPSPTPS